MTIEFRPLSDALGAEAVGVNVADDLSDATIAELNDGWLRYKILLFCNQDLTVEQQMAFTGRFGKLMNLAPPAKPFILEHPEMSVFSNISVDGKPIGARPDRAFGDNWHSDNSFLRVPAGGSFFYAKEVPEEGGDDTWYANMTTAYEALPDEMKSKLEGLRWNYSHLTTLQLHNPKIQSFTEEDKRALPDVSHPFVHTHPETGERALFIGILDTREASVDGMSKQEGIDFLDELRTFATQPQFTYTQQWTPGEAIFWDNRCVLHRGSIFPDTSGRRLCYRATTLGVAPS